jgi:phosphoserine phosphatase
LIQWIESRRGIAAFDFDNTLIKNDFGEAIMLSLCKTGNLPELLNHTHLFPNPEEARKIFLTKDYSLITQFIFDEYDRILVEKGLEPAYRWSSFLFAGISESDCVHISQSVWEETNSTKIIYPFPEMLQLIQFLKDAKWEVFIVTASPVWAIQTVSYHFQISPENVIGMELEWEMGKTTSKIREPYTYGEGKVKAFVQRNGKKPDLAFGDSINDYPLLVTSAKGVLLNRGKDSSLVELCRQNSISVYPIFS